MSRSRHLALLGCLQRGRATTRRSRRARAGRPVRCPAASSRPAAPGRGRSCRAAAPSRPAGGLRSHGTAVNWTRWVSSCRQTQSRKSVGSTWSSRSTCTMFGATRSSRPPYPGVVVVPSARPRQTGEEGVELPQHLVRQVGEQAARLDTGHPGPDRRRERAGLGPRPAQLVDQRVDHLSQAVDVRLHPTAPGRRRRPARSPTPSRAVCSRARGPRPPPRSDAGRRPPGGLGPADVRPRSHEPLGGRDGEIPVDHGRRACAARLRRVRKGCLPCGLRYGVGRPALARQQPQVDSAAAIWSRPTRASRVSLAATSLAIATNTSAWPVLVVVDSGERAHPGEGAGLGLDVTQASPARRLRNGCSGCRRTRRPAAR